ncbi:MAG TPA: hypothetical protein VLT56_00725 [Desulfobacterales bacterium]|nr:hypothetical protein [Desulfobacterales bacterium]
MKKRLLVLTFGMLLGVTGGPAGAYDYKVDDPYVSTIVGTPEVLEWDKLPKKVDYELLGLKVFPDRPTPDVFWYQREFLYTLSYQKQEAPLIFVIAGTGSSFYATSMIFLQKAFYGAGFHVICLSSPTQMNFIATASATSVPGNIVEDAQDLYRVMTLAWEQVKDRIKVSEFYLTGYSLGGSQSAFVSKLDEERRVFNFKKVLMINPAVSLYTSAKILDDMLLQINPNLTPEVFDRWFDERLAQFAAAYKLLHEPPLDHDFLYDAYRVLHKKGRTPRREDLAGMIGTVFRLASSNMIFTADVMANYGLIVPKNRALGSADSLTDYMKVTNRVSFIDYFNEFLYPYSRSRNPGLTKEALIEGTSLRSIESYLRNSPKIVLMDNEDDLILAPEDLAFLKDVFGSRAKIYPYGGHLGNMTYAANVAYMINVFKN